MLRPMSDHEKVLLQQVILPVFAAPLDGRLFHLGSSFVISALGRQALLLSAAHVFRQALTVDEARERHHPSTPLEFLVARSSDRNLKSTRLLVLYRERVNAGHFAEILDVYINDPFDIAVCSVYFPDSVPANVHFPSKLAIDTTPPAQNVPIIAAGYGDTKLEVDIDDSNIVSTATFNSKLDYRHGSITEVYPSGHEALHLGPSFQIGVPISSGMSGGPVINKLYGDRVVACGINTSDLSVGSQECSGSGLRAIAQMLWPCAGIVVKHAEVDNIKGPIRLLELMRRGFVDDLGNAASHVVGVPAPEVQQFSMAWQ